MKFFLSIATSLVLAAQAPCALADTIYKCVGANGKIAFSSLPCEGQAKQARQLAVPPPEAPEVSAARLKRERERMQAANNQAHERRVESDADAEDERSHRAYNNRTALAEKEQAARNQEAARRASSRVGNCTTRREEAGCL